MRKHRPAVSDVPSLSIVIPVYNEEERLPATLSTIRQYLATLHDPSEVIVADDGSSDGTVEVARAAGATIVQLPQHVGKGAAVRAGVLASRGRYVLITDADLATPVTEIERLLRALDGRPGVAIGSRGLKDSWVEREALHRRLMGRVFNGLVQLLVLRGLADTQCGFKLFSGDLARTVFERCGVDGFAFDVEAILLVRRLHYPVVEVPVQWEAKPGSRVRPVQDAYLMFMDVLRIWWKVQRRPAIAWPLSEAGTVFACALLFYLAVGLVLVFGDNIVFRDTLARVEAAQRILFSRDPHLAAIGFVWGPLPSLTLLPLIPLKVVWPALTRLGIAGDLLSVVCMAATVREFWLILKDLEVGQATRVVLTGLFAAHPLIVLFAANGMSEAMFLLWLLIATRQLLRWLRSEQVDALVAGGLAVAAAVLTRYEALPAAVVATLVVGGVAYARARGPEPVRRSYALADGLTFAAPVGTAAVTWFVISWLITGHPLEQFASLYGNTSQLQASGVTAASAAGHFAWFLTTLDQAITLEPLVLTVILATVLVAVGRREIAVVGILAVLLPVLGFMFLADAAGAVTHELRYLIVEIPLAGLMAGLLLRPGMVELPRRLRPELLPLGAALLLAPGTPAGMHALLDYQLDPVDAAQMQSMVSRATPLQRAAANRFVTEREIAVDLDQRHLRPGSVLVDDFLGFSIVVSSSDPKQFVITSDRDFEAALSDPPGVSVQYILVPEPAGLGLLDAVNRQYPRLYATGAGLGSLVHEYQNVGDGTTWRLYAVRTGE